MVREPKSQSKEWEAVIKENRMLTERNRLQERLIEAMAHDVRAPLAAMKSMKELLNSGVLNHNPGLWDVAFSEMDMLLERVDILLDGLVVLRLSATEYPIEVIDVSSVIYSLPSSLERYAATKNITLRTEMEEDALILSNHYLLSLVLRTLWDSVIRHSESGEGITMSVCIKAQHVVFLIECGGLAISQGTLAAINQGQLSRGLKQTSGEQGLGFAFHIAWKVVEYLQGKLLVQQAEVMGSCITLQIPRFLAKGRSVIQA